MKENQKHKQGECNDDGNDLCNCKNKRPNRPKKYLFDTEIQAIVESEMTQLGYGCEDYNLLILLVSGEPNEK